MASSIGSKRRRARPTRCCSPSLTPRSCSTTKKTTRRRPPRRSRCPARSPAASRSARTATGTSSPPRKAAFTSSTCMSHRLGAPTDLLLTLLNNTGKGRRHRAARRHAGDAQSHALLHAQSRPGALSLRGPGRRRVSDPGRQPPGGHAWPTRSTIYRLRITEERPDFRLIVMPPDTYRPDACIVGQGGNNMHRRLCVAPRRLQGRHSARAWRACRPA